MREFLKELIEALRRGHRFVTYDVWRIGKPGEQVPSGLLIKHIRVAILLFKGLMSDVLWLRTSALAFATILAIVPFLAFIFFIMQTFDLAQSLTDVLENQIQDYAKRVGVVRDEGDQPSSRSEERQPGVPSETPSATPALPATEPVPPDMAGPEADEETLGPPSRAGPESPRSARSTRPTAEDAEERTSRNRELLESGLGWLLEGVPSPEGVQDDMGTDSPLTVILEMAQESGQSTAMGTFLGIVFVFFSVFGLMYGIESAFNAIWGTKRNRSWFRIFTDYMLIVLILPFVVAFVVGLTTALETEDLAWGPLALLLSGARYLVLWLALATVYYVVPNTKVPIRYALLGGVIAGTIWIITAKAFLHFQWGVAKANFFYGSFALIPLTLVWIYTCWLIILFGAQITFAYQYEKTFAMERLAERASYAYKEAIALRAVTEVSRRFDAGLPPLSAAECAAEWNVPVRLLNDTLDELEKEGLLRPANTEPVQYQPARSIDKITVGDVLKAMREYGRDPSALREDESMKPLLQKIYERENGIMNMTVEHAIEEFHLGASDQTPASQETHEESQQDDPGENTQ
ncbi:MAG: YhjD/YihY/BrkB family envelope integrity protein [Candidatus Hydrogenedentes bacterium]|nr:YhjD/YihY/BrkB family envelope integrity protein [Candidatus Hydrogenedentota bacterium]